jgi:UDP-N-acetylmuramoyl-tripeptide--D-alanyl-D-alanine ligase
VVTLGEFLRLLPGAQLHAAGDTAAALLLTGVSTDTRTLARGNLFVALRGERFDGHAFSADALAAGAAALLVDHALDVAAPQIVVPDTRRALGQAAAEWRSRFNLPVIAVTGSNGKTTVTQMLAAILAAAYPDKNGDRNADKNAERGAEKGANNGANSGANGGRRQWLATRGNLNNDIGLPLMVFELRKGHRAAVFELGMNHPGEIALLANIARPTIALVNNAQREHQEFMSSVEATARENGAAIALLPPDGVAVFPADDGCAGIWRELAGTRRVVDFAQQGQATVTAQAAAHPLGARLEVASPAGAFTIELAVSGAHNARNALAATACALAAGVRPVDIAAGLAAFMPVRGRGVRHLLGAGTLLVDDSYNANPDSVRAAIELLATLPAPRTLVLGDMGEVGAQRPAFHREVGAHARSLGIDRLLALGVASVEAAAAFGPGATHCADVDALIGAARVAAAGGGSLLVKGSRFMRLERVVAALTGGAAGAH